MLWLHLRQLSTKVEIKYRLAIVVTTVQPLTVIKHHTVKSVMFGVSQIKWPFVVRIPYFHQVCTVHSVFSDVPCSVPRDLQNSEWQYKGEDNYIQYTSSLRFHTTKLLHFSIPPSFPDEELYLPNWTCINTFNISNEETIVVFK